LMIVTRPLSRSPRSIKKVTTRIESRSHRTAEIEGVQKFDQSSPRGSGTMNPRVKR
jgi:hypothetical protein